MRTSVGLWEDTVRKNPGGFRPIANLAYQYHVAGRNAESITTYRKALAINADFAQGRLNLAAILNSQGRYREALEELDLILAKHAEAKSKPLVVQTLATSYANLGRINDSVQLLERAVQEQPQQIWPHMSLSSIYQALEERSRR